MDYRNNTLSALARNGSVDRDECLKIYDSEPIVEEGLEDYVRKRLELSENEYQWTMKATPKKWYEFPTYKKIFEFMRPVFFPMAKANLVPMSFYLKYCFPSKRD